MTELLGSGSMHVTFDKMIRGNGNIASEIPTHAEVDVYGVNDVLSVTEIVAFIEAVKAFGGDNFATISFTFASLTLANRDTALSSMIVRNTFTDEIEAAVTAKNFTIDPFNPTYVIPNTDYMDNSPLTFLTKSGALAALDFVNS
ncbi:MAG: hypothetical protein MZU97_24915 [Bacillus subtilis]|nr:hypothetical protein [Bacillus subtilis]